MARNKRKNRIRTVLRVNTKGRDGPARAEPLFAMPRVLAFVMDSAGVGALPDAASSAMRRKRTPSVTSRNAWAVCGCRIWSRGSARPHHDDTRGGRGRSSGRGGWASAREVTRQRHNHGSLGDGWDCDRNALPDLPRRLSARGHQKHCARRSSASRRSATSRPTGTEIIAELGEEHQRTGRPILYTSADSVFQVAAHEDTVPFGDAP